MFEGIMGYSQASCEHEQFLKYRHANSETNNNRAKWHTYSNGIFGAVTSEGLHFK
jgi:hypothetical protein